MYKSASFKKILITLSIIILIIFASYHFIFLDIKSKNENISLLSQELASQSNKQDYLISTQKMLESINSDITNINKSIVAKGGDVAFIENLESIAKSNGLVINIDTLVFEDEKKLSSAGLTVFKIRAKTRGTWAGTYGLLSQLESLPFKIKINKFAVLAETSDTFDAKKLKPANVMWQGSFEIVVLKYK